MIPSPKAKADVEGVIYIFHNLVVCSTTLVVVCVFDLSNYSKRTGCLSLTPTPTDSLASSTIGLSTSYFPSGTGKRKGEAPRLHI